MIANIIVRCPVRQFKIISPKFLIQCSYFHPYMNIPVTGCHLMTVYDVYRLYGECGVYRLTTCFSSCLTAVTP